MSKIKSHKGKTVLHQVAKTVSAKANVSSTKADKAPKAEAETGSQLVQVSPKAISAKVGPLVLSLMQKGQKMQVEVSQLAEAVKFNKYEQLGRVTHALWLAAKADPKISLQDIAFAEGKGKGKFIELADVILGVKVIDGSEVKYAPDVAKLMPPKSPSKDYKETDAYRRQADLRSNFRKVVTKGAQDAYGMLLSGATVEFDENKKTIVVTNAPKQIAGPSGTVVLTGGKPVEGATLSPSLEEFGKIARKSVGKAEAPGKATDAQAIATKALESEDAFGELCNSLIRVINGLEGNVSPTQEKHLLSVNDAILKVLGSE